MIQTALANYDAGRRALQLASKHDEVRAIRDKAEALAAYARQAKDDELLSWVTEIKVRAERRAGELIVQQQAAGELAKQGKPTKMSNASTLTDAGISRDDSSRWQKMAAIPEQAFENAIATAKETIGEVTTAYMLRAARPERDASATHKATSRQFSTSLADPRDEQLRRFYVVVKNCIAITELEMQPSEWLDASPVELRRVILPAIEPTVEWLLALIDELRGGEDGQSKGYDLARTKIA